LPVVEAHKYTLGLTVTVMSVIPATYPLIAATFNEALAVLVVKVKDLATRFDLP
jgi:hypothetical protein